MSKKYAMIRVDEDTARTLNDNGSAVYVITDTPKEPDAKQNPCCRPGWDYSESLIEEQSDFYDGADYGIEGEVIWIEQQ